MKSSRAAAAALAQLLGVEEDQFSATTPSGLVEIGLDVEAGEASALRAVAGPGARGGEADGDAAGASSERPIADEQAHGGLSGVGVCESHPGGGGEVGDGPIEGGGHGGRWPLSVSTDRLGMTAIRCAGILSQLAEAGVNVDRSGVGRVVEVYPGATLRGWGLDTSGYRTSAQVREKLLANLCAEAPWLSIGVHGALMVSSGDAFDAVVAALAARAAYLGGYHKPANHQLDAAKVEGWLALPTLSLGDLR